MKKILATILALVMALALCTTSWADGEGEGGTTPPASTTAVAKIGEQEYTTLQAAINAASGSENTVVLLKDLTESITIASDKNVTLDLNGKTLTNEAGKHTITNNGTLTITATNGGTVDNVSHGCGALVNKVGATATLNGGKFTRSAEKGTKDGPNGNSWYAIKNYGTMEINSGVTVEANGGYSSLIANGWQNATDLKNNPKSEGSNAKLTIKGGTFTGGINTVKNDDYGELLFKDGECHNYTQAAFQNHNIAKITGGTFEVNGATYAVYNCPCSKTADKGELDISGGNFVGEVYNYTGYMTEEDSYGHIKISGGKFSTNVKAYAETGSTPIASLKGVYYVGADSIETAVNSMSGGDTLTVIQGSVKVGNTEYGANQTYTKPTSYYYYSPSTTTPDTTTKGSPKTFDAGIALYVGMALTSVTGLAYTGKKKF